MAIDSILHPAVHIDDRERGPFDLARGTQYIVIVALNAIVWTILVFLMRVFLRKKVNGPFGWDDGACAVATFFGIAFSALTLLNASYGLGEDMASVEDFQPNNFRLIMWTQTMLYMFATCFAQVSVALLICRIARVRTQLIISYGLATIGGICCIVSVLLVAFGCKFPRPWGDFTTRCAIGRWPVWLSHTIITGLIELFLVKTAILLV